MTQNGRSQPESTLEPLLTPKEVAALLRLDIRTIYRYVQQGTLPVVRIKKTYRFARQDILEFLRQGHQQAVPSETTK